MKLVLTPMYDINLKNWYIDYINKVVKTFGKVSRGIYLRLQYLQSKESDKIEQFQDTGFYTPVQQSEVVLLYPDLLKLLPYEYYRHQSQKQEPSLFFQQIF